MSGDPRLRLTNRRDGAVTVVSLRGEVDVYTVPLLREYLAALVEAGHRRLVLDLAELTFMDSTGLAALVGIWRLLRTHAGFLGLAAAPQRIEDLLQLTRLDLAFRTYGTVADAVTAGDSSRL